MAGLGTHRSRVSRASSGAVARLARRQEAPRKKSATKRTANDVAAEREIKIGLRLKHARIVQNLRLRELAEKLDCSESFISKVENDKVRPSLAMLHRIVSVLGINIATLFAEPDDDSPVLVVRANSRARIRTDPLLNGPGIVTERLVAKASGALIEAGIHCIDPGGHTDGVLQHAGEEIGFVLQGRFELQVEGTSYLLEEGDCFFFRSELKHGYRNPGSVRTKVLMVCTPPTF